MSQDMFERELTRRAEDVHGAPFSLADVRGRATSIKRRRRAAVAGGVAAAVALVAIVPAMLGGDGGPKSDGVDPAPPAPGNTAVLHDGTLTLPSGDTVALDVDNADVQQLAVLTDGRIVVASSEPYGIQVFNPDGTLQERYPAQVNALTTSADDSAVAWVGGERISDRDVRVLESGVAEPTLLPGIPAAGESTGFVSAVLAPDRLLVDGGNGTDAVLTPDATEPSGLDELVTVTDVSPDGSLWAVRYPDQADPQFGCSGLWDPDAGEMVARSCDTALLEFAPDGQHLTGALGDNRTWGSVEVFDLDLEQVASLEPDRGSAVSDWAWSDADHLLVSEADPQGTAWRLVEVDIEAGEREVVAGPVGGGLPESMSEFLFSA